MFSSSLGKKYLMALTGVVLIGFVFVHMAGNLQMLAGQEQINAYAHALQSLPWFVLWGSRLFLLLCVVLHAWFDSLGFYRLSLATLHDPSRVS